MRKLLVFITALVLVAAGSRSIALAKPEYVTSFTARYPKTAGTALAACATCHNAQMALNAYGQALEAAKLDYASIEGKDSDGDGATNLAEINALTNPGDPASKPAGTGSGSGGSGSGSAGGSTGSAASYRDIVGNAAQSSIETLVKAGVFAGGGGYFRPNANVTRAEFAVMLQRLFGLPATAPYLAAYSDVPKNHWAWSSVETIVRAGLMTAPEKGTFVPGGKVTRADAVRSAVIALAHGADVAGKSDAEAVAAGASLGLVAAGADPSHAMTRGDAAILLAKVLAGKKQMADPLAGITNYDVGPTTCAKCHSEVAGEMATTLHSRMVRPMAPGATDANFADPKAGIKASDVQFVIGSNETNYFVGKDLNYLPASWNVVTQTWGKRNVSSWLTGCASCHTTGYDKNLGTFVALDITCESCHGPGAEHVAGGGDTSKIKVSLDVDSCQPCHGGERQAGQLTETVHYTVFADFIQQPSYKDNCMECHSATVRMAEEKGETPPTLADFKTGDLQNDRVGITCVVCHDPHQKTNESQLRQDAQELCIDCHTAELTTDTFTAGKVAHHPQKEMWEGKGAIGVPAMPAAKTATCVDCHMTNGNHLFEVGTPTITLPVHGKDTAFDSCASCHTGMTAEKIQGLFDEFDARLAALKDQLAKVDEHIAHEKSFGRDMSAAQALRDKAYTNLSFVEADKSKGIHNPAYVKAIFDVSEQFLEEAMKH